MEETDEFRELVRARTATRLEALNLTPIRAATQAGLPRDTLRNLFREGGSLPRVDTIQKIAAALETTVAYLIGETAYPGLDWADDNRMAWASAAVEAARPIPVIARAGWEVWDQLADPDDPLDVIHLNVPGFESAPLFAAQVVDDHADIAYGPGRYVVWTDINILGQRDGDHIVVLRQRPGTAQDEPVNITVRALHTVRHKMHGRRSGSIEKEAFAWSGGFVSLSKTEGKYPDTGFSRDSYYKDPARVFGIVVADLGFHAPMPGPALYIKADSEVQRLEWNEWYRKYYGREPPPDGSAPPDEGDGE